MKYGKFRKGLVLGVMVLFIGTSVVPSISSNMNVYKGSIGRSTTLYVGGSGPGNYTSIQDAIDNATDNDTVFVYNGTYIEYIIIERSIHLIGEDKRITFIGGGEQQNPTVRINADDVIIRAFTIQNSSIVCSAIFCESVNTTIENCDFTNNWHGIRFNGKNNKIIRCNFFNNSRLAIAIHATNSQIINCHAESNNFGIYVESSYTKIINFTSYVRISLELGSSHNITITNSSFHNYEQGINIVGNSYNNTISNNCFYGDNAIGIQEWNNYNNTIYNNSFFGINQRAWDKGTNNWDNGSRGNYWDDYTGPDGDGNGIGDTPYNISGGDNQDRYPLMMPTIPDNDKPVINITKPDQGLYISDNKIGSFKLNKSLIIGKINVTVEVSDNTTSIDRVEFFVDEENEPVYIDNTCFTGEANWSWLPKTLERMKKPFKSEYKIKIVAYDQVGNNNSGEISVKRISPAAVIGGILFIIGSTIAFGIMILIILGLISNIG